MAQVCNSLKKHKLVQCMAVWMVVSNQAFLSIFNVYVGSETFHCA